MTKLYEFRPNNEVLYKGEKIGAWYHRPDRDQLDRFEKAVNNHNALADALVQACNAMAMTVDPETIKPSEKINAYVACLLAEAKARAALEALK